MKVENYIFNYLIKILSLVYLSYLLIILLTLFFSVNVTSLFLIFKNSEVLNSIFVSLFTATVSTFMALVFGVSTSYYLFKSSGNKIRRYFLVIADLPVVLPPLIAGLSILIFFGFLKRNDILIDLLFTKKSIILAQFFVASPFMLKSIIDSMESIPQSILRSTRLLSKNEFYNFFHVILPLIKNGILTGITLCFARSLGEFGATAMVAGSIVGKNSTITTSIYNYANIGDYNSSIGLSIFLISIFFMIFIKIKSI